MKSSLLKLSIGLFLAGCTSLANAQTGYIVHDLTTGIVNGTATPIAYTSPDDTWTVAKPDRPGGFQPVYVCSNLNGSWGVNDCGRWLTPYLDGINPSGAAMAGTYNYKTTFNMSHHCIPWAKAIFSYVGGDDNVIGFTINGYSYTLNPPSVNDFSPIPQNITININPNHILLGTNTIIVNVNNLGTFTGFYACGNVSIGYCPMPAGNGSMTPKEIQKFPAGESMRISPNPSSGEFLLELRDPAEGNITIFDLVGRKVASYSTNAETAVYHIDLSKLVKGIYNVSVRSGSGNTVSTSKIVLE
jgi:hypothetical protein